MSSGRLDMEGQPFSSSHAPELEAEFSGLHIKLLRTGYRQMTAKSNVRNTLRLASMEAPAHG